MMAQAVVTPAAAPSPARSPIKPEQWWILVTVVFGVFVSLLDATIVNTAIPKIQAVFGVSIHEAQYISTAYTLAQAVAVGASSFLAARYGSKRVFLTSLALFTAGSALCGLASNDFFLILFRILQGAGGAALFPIGIALVFSSFTNDQRGLVNGLFGIPVLFAPAIGPTVGGYIVQYFDWRWIFYVNVPLGILGVLVGARYLPAVAGRAGMRFSVRTFLPLAAGLGLMLYGLTNISTDGWGSLLTVSGPAALGALLLALYVVLSLVTPEPVLDLQVFRNRNFLVGNIIISLATVGLFGAQFLLPQYLQNLRGLDAFHSGLELLPVGLAAMVSTIFAGVFYNSAGPIVLMVFGAALLVGDTYLLANWVGSPTAAYAALPLLLILRGLSIPPLAQTANTMALQDIRGIALNSASTLVVVTRLVVASLALAVFTNILTAQQAAHRANLVVQVTPDSPTARTIATLSAHFQAGGMPAGQAATMAFAQVYRQILILASSLAFRDVFYISALLAVPAIVLPMLYIGRSRPAPDASAHSE